MEQQISASVEKEWMEMMGMQYGMEPREDDKTLLELKDGVNGHVAKSVITDKVYQYRILADCVRMYLHQCAGAPINVGIDIEPEPQWNFGPKEKDDGAG